VDEEGAMTTNDVSPKSTATGTRPVHTYSIVAIDNENGDMGVAVQSHWFSVGSVVTWGEAGVGVVATQAFANPAFGPKGLDLMRSGLSPAEAVDIVLSSDEGRESRQLALLDTKGRVAAHTGKACIAEAGHIVGKGYSVQANMMLRRTVWPSMARAFEKARGPLAERMLGALEAAEKARGDIRGRQSAALLVVRGRSTGRPWADRLVDLRVDDSSEPLQELKRLLKMHRAYESMNQGDEELEKGHMRAAMRCYSAAEEMFPENLEMRFWHGVTLANCGRLEEAVPILRQVFEEDDHWRVLLKRLPKAGVLKADANSLLAMIKTK